MKVLWVSEILLPAKIRLELLVKPTLCTQWLKFPNIYLIFLQIESQTFDLQKVTIVY